MFFDKLKNVTMVLNGLLMMLTFAITFAYFKEQTGDLMKFDIPDIFYPIVAFGVVGVSVLTAIFHIVGGGIMGATAGGVLMGMKMGFFLGLAYALGRLWIFAGSSFVASILFWPEFKWSIIGLGLATITCLVIEKATSFIWSRVESQ